MRSRLNAFRLRLPTAFFYSLVNHQTTNAQTLLYLEPADTQKHS
jgi:hypothetical protein